jgi:hypothetical protein
MHSNDRLKHLIFWNGGKSIREVEQTLELRFLGSQWGTTSVGGRCTASRLPLSIIVNLEERPLPSRASWRATWCSALASRWWALQSTVATDPHETFSCTAESISPPSTHSSKVDYSHFIMVAVLVMLERLEKWPGAIPVAFPPPIFAEITSVSWFRVSPPPPRENALENLYTELF